MAQDGSSWQEAVAALARMIIEIIELTLSRSIGLHFLTYVLFLYNVTPAPLISGDEGK